MTSYSIDDESSIRNELQQLRTQLNKKQTFESAVTSLKSLLLQSYPSSSTSTQKLFYDVVCRVNTVLRTRYTAPGFLLAGVDLLQTAASLSADPAQVSHLNSASSALHQSLRLDDENPSPPTRGNGFLFEGHLTVDSEPPQPNWLIQQNLLTALASQSQNNSGNISAENGDDDDNNNNNNNNNDVMGSLLMGLVESLDVSMLEGLEDLLPADLAARRAAPPASKVVVEKLPVVTVDGEVLAKVGEDAECCICKEKLGVGDQMQEMPCKHLFHPLCLKPWLDEHNSCPTCRHELPTDDHKYESRKEREKELEEERRGAANAVREGEFMYI
ncbi:E3 ubiquitin-protein ligase AIP2 [Silene latifolia]|uniref:E3 ubiquitin-protein ligase AIP2 n=1 Tax=Silene latifolia TaxID=37657 RepID=UPI003D7853BF